jgi:hypothetical protein
MARKLDTEARDVAAEIADTIHASPEARQTGILIGARAYRRGQATVHPEVARLEAEIASLRRKLAAAEASAEWTPAEVSYVDTLKRYGMKVADIGEVFGVSVDSVRRALRLNKDKTIRFAGDRARSRRRLLDAD